MAQQATMHRRGPGRPRAFEVDAALDAALLVFRERGYHATSMTDIGAAMKLTPGSIYKAFSDKRTIFLAVFNRYVERGDTRLRPLLDAASSGFDKVRVLLRFYAEASHGAEGQRGCLVVGSATEIATFDPEMAARVAVALERLETRLGSLIRLGQNDGSVSADINADATARALLCVLEGLRVIGKTGRTRTDMMATVDQAMRMLA